MNEKDPLYDDAVAYVVDEDRASTTMIQRHFKIGYGRASRIISDMEAEGIISEIQPNGTRIVNIGSAPLSDLEGETVEVLADGIDHPADDADKEITIDGINFDSSELSGILVARMVEELKAAPDVWQKLSEDRQDEALSRFRQFAETYVQRALAVFASADRPTLYATLDKVVVKDGIQATITMPKNSEDRHELFDSQGKDILVVVLDSQVYTGGTEKVRSEKDQKDLL